MKIIGVDNFARETVADTLLISGIPDTAEHKQKAEAFCDWLNSMHPNAFITTYYRVVGNDYALWRGMEELV